MVGFILIVLNVLIGAVIGYYVCCRNIEKKAGLCKLCQSCYYLKNFGLENKYGYYNPNRNESNGTNGNPNNGTEPTGSNGYGSLNFGNSKPNNGDSEFERSNSDSANRLEESEHSKISHRKYRL